MAEAARFAHHMSDEDALMWNIEKDPVLRSTILAAALFVALAPHAGERPDHEVPAALAPDNAPMFAVMRYSIAHTRRRAMGIAQRAPMSIVHGAAHAVSDPIGTASQALRTTRSIAR